MFNTNWKPTRNSKIPIYEQIKDYIKELIQNGDLTIGSKLPSQRYMANIFEVNRSTIVTALQELEAEGIVMGKNKSYTSVINNTWSMLSSTPPPDWISYIKSGIHQPNFYFIQQINKMEFEKDIIRLGTGELSPQIFPQKMMNKVMNNVNKRNYSLGYEEPKGSLHLRSCLSKYLTKFNINADPSQILVVSGALQALQLISIGLLYKGSTILTEKPSYLYSIHVAQSVGMKLMGVPMKNNGIDIESLIKYRRQYNGSILYTIPSFHNPTGITMNSLKRKELLRVCEDMRLPIIEDDVYRELWSDTPSPSPLKSIDKNGLVLYLGSMSKTLSPGLRIGWVVGPEPVIERLGDIKMQTDYGSSSLSQTAAAEWFATGLYEEYSNIIRDELRYRRVFALEILNKYFKDIAKWNMPNGGFYIWMELNEKLSMLKLFEACLNKKILINPGEIYFHTNNQFIRISYAYASYEDFKKGMIILSQEIERLYK